MLDTSAADDEELSARSIGENDNNDESLDYSDGDDGHTEGNYDVNSDKNSAGDSLSESGSYSPNSDQLEEDNSLLEQGTYRPRSAAEQEGADLMDGGQDEDGNPDDGNHDDGQGDPIQIIDDLIDHAVHDMCDDSESDLGSYHINSDNDEADGEQHDSELSEAEYDMSSGADSDEAYDNSVELLRVKYNTRQDNPILPDTVSVLESEGGGKVYLVGTAHFSEKSQQDVAEVIIFPNRVDLLASICNFNHHKHLNLPKKYITFCCKISCFPSYQCVFQLPMDPKNPYCYE